jgi:hypothetical protein
MNCPQYQNSWGSYNEENCWEKYYTVKKVSNFLSKLFPARESLIIDISAGDGKIANLFLQCSVFQREMIRSLGQGYLCFLKEPGQ